MRIILAIIIAVGIVVLLAGGLTAQTVSFECQLAGAPFPICPLVDCEWVCAAPAASQVLSPSVDIQPCCGLPGGLGLQYAVVPAAGDPLGNGPQPPPGGPIARPLTGFENELRIPIPSGASGVSFLWEFYEYDELPFNDAFTVEVVDPATGRAVQAPLVYSDVTTWTAGPCNESRGLELGAPAGVDNGPQHFSGVFAPLPPGAYLSVVCLDGLDSYAHSIGLIDEVVFSTGPACGHVIDQPLGTGSLRFAIQGCMPDAIYLRPVTFAQHAWPHGWLHGVDIGVYDLLFQIQWGAPFLASLDGSGNSDFTLSVGVPSGISLYSGCGLYEPLTGRLWSGLPPVSLTTQ